MIALVLMLLAADGLSKDQVAKVVRMHTSEVKLCYEQQLTQFPHLRGKVTIQFTIAASGKVSDVFASETEGLNDTVVDCVMARTQTWKFPRPRGGEEVEIAYPFVFTSADEELDDSAGRVAPDDALPAVDAEAPPTPSPEERRRESEEMERKWEQDERDHPPGLVELWAMGGAGMYPVALGLLLGLGCGLLGLVLALTGARRPAVILAGLCLGGGAWAFSTGWLGYVNGVIGTEHALAHVNPIDHGIILRAGQREASVCWKFGSIVFGLNAAVGAASFAAALARKQAPRV